jgi:hypothetical protein
MLSYAGTSVPIMLPGRLPTYTAIPTVVTKWYALILSESYHETQHASSGYWLKQHGLSEVGIFHKELHTIKPAKKLRAEFEKPPDVRPPPRSAGCWLDSDRTVRQETRHEGPLHGRARRLRSPRVFDRTARACHTFRTVHPIYNNPRYVARHRIIPNVPNDVDADDAPSREEALQRIEQALHDMPHGARELLLYICDLLVAFAKHAPRTSWRPSGPELPTNMLSVRGRPTYHSCSSWLLDLTTASLVRLGSDLQAHALVTSRLRLARGPRRTEV